MGGANTKRSADQLATTNTSLKTSEERRSTYLHVFSHCCLPVDLKRIIAKIATVEEGMVDHDGAKRMRVRYDRVRWKCEIEWVSSL